MENLHNWLFHYSSYNKTWSAFKKDNINNYFNGILDDVLTSKNQKTLQNIITKFDGDIDKIHEFFNNNG
jgi:hypothetical protein